MNENQKTMIDKRVKKETTLAKIPRKRGRLKATELSARGSANDTADTSLVGGQSGSQCGRDEVNELQDSRLKAPKIRYVPVVSMEGTPLTPTTPARARKWVKSRKATWFWSFGIYCVRLNMHPSDGFVPDICVGVDTGSKKEAFTIKSEHHTYLNIQSDAVTWVKDKVETRRNLRRGRRYRNSPCRKNKLQKNINKKKLAPSTKARWQVKLRIINKISKLFKITHFTIEDVAAIKKKNQRNWNVNFSHLEIGKQWFYGEIKKLGSLETKQGYETAQLRIDYGLKKISNKMSSDFHAHCVDSWVLANYTTGGHIKPDNTDIIYVRSLNFYRRQLHVQNPITRGVRKKYGGTISEGFKRGSLVVNPKYGVCFIGGASERGVSLHSVKDGKRLCQRIRASEIRFLAYNSFLINN